MEAKAGSSGAGEAAAGMGDERVGVAGEPETR